MTAHEREEETFCRLPESQTQCRRQPARTAFRFVMRRTTEPPYSRHSRTADRGENWQLSSLGNFTLRGNNPGAKEKRPLEQPLPVSNLSAEVSQPAVPTQTRWQQRGQPFPLEEFSGQDSQDSRLASEPA